MLITILIILIVLATAYALAFKDEFPMILVWRTYIVFGGLVIVKNLGVVVSIIMDSIFSIF